MKKMKYGRHNAKAMNKSDVDWYHENINFKCSVVKSIHEEQSEYQKDLKQQVIQTHGLIRDRDTNKLFFKEFKNWFKHYERIVRDTTYNLENDDNDYDDKTGLITKTLMTLSVDYQNTVLMKTLIKCAKFVGENYLNKTDYRVLMTILYSDLDFKDGVTIKALIDSFEEIGSIKGTEKEYQERHETILNILTGQKYIESRQMEEKDIQSIKDNKWVVLYRGFFVRDDESIRHSRGMKNGDVDEHGYKKEDCHYWQKCGSGLSYSFSKRTAYTFALQNAHVLQKYLQEQSKKIKLVVGQYFVNTKDIYSYENRRDEREVITKHAFLHHYEIVHNDYTNLDDLVTGYDKSFFDEKGNMVVKCNIVNYNNKEKSAIHNLNKELKIHRIYNNTAKLQKAYNNSELEIAS